MKEATPEATYCLISLISGIRKRQIDRKQVRDSMGWGRGVGVTDWWVSDVLLGGGVALELGQVMFVPYCICSKYHWVLHFKMESFKWCVFSINFFKGLEVYSESLCVVNSGLLQSLPTRLLPPGLRLLLRAPLALTPGESCVSEHPLDPPGPNPQMTSCLESKHSDASLRLTSSGS